MGIDRKREARCVRVCKSNTCWNEPFLRERERGRGGMVLNKECSFFLLLLTLFFFLYKKARPSGTLVTNELQEVSQGARGSATVGENGLRKRRDAGDH